MKSLDEIIKEYGQLINPANNEAENLIQDAIPSLIEGFVEFYGEESREEIIEKFNRIKIVFPPLDMYESFNYILTYELKQYMKERYPSEYEPFFSLSKLKDTETRDGKSQEYINALDEIIKKTVPYQELYERYSKIKDLFSSKADEELKGELNHFIKETLTKELNYPNEMANLHEYSVGGNLVFNTFRQFVDGSFYNFDRPDDLNSSLVALRNLGINIPPLNCESKDYWEWTGEEFKAAKEEFIKLINDPNISRYIPSKEVAQKIMNKNKSLEEAKKERVNIELANQFYGIKNDYSNYLGVEVISSLGIEYNGGFEPNLIKCDGKTEVGGILSLNKFTVKITSLGEILIHEANHGLETTVIGNGPTYIFKSGWDVAQIRDSTSHKKVAEYNHYSKFGFRPQELLNECINNLITMEILNNVRKKTNNIIFSEIEKDRYSNAHFVVEEFYQLYKYEIIESRKNHNMDALYQKIGKENFEALAELMRIVSSRLYAEKFDYERIKQDLENGIENEETKFLIDVINQRDQILNSMRVYSQTTHRSRGIISIYGIIILIIITIVMIYLTLLS